MSTPDDTVNTLDSNSTENKIAYLQEGSRIHRYQILRLIGKGGMGAVYQAYDPELDRSIAIKILAVVPQEGETASRPQTRLMREAQALAKLSHPHVVAVHDVGTYEDGVYIAMEYVNGKTLRTWLKDEKPSQKQIIRVFLDAGKGLQAAHTEGLVHRDFKPDNVIVGDRGQVKVLDFGLARAADNERLSAVGDKSDSAEEIISGENLLTTPLTQVGATIGTTVYMAPEHFQGQELDEKTDQFSFCVTLFEALYGQRPFPGKTIHALKRNITGGWVEIPKTAEVPKWIEDIILKGLSVSKADRFGSIAQLLASLENDPEIAKTRRRKKQLFVLAIILGAILFMGLGTLLFRYQDELCSGASRKTTKIWSDNNKTTMKQVFAKTGLSYANDTFVRVAKRIDDYLADWTTAFTQACEATRLRKEQSEETMDLKMRCLDRSLLTASALIKVLREADKTVVAKSIQAVSSLSDLSRCNDVEALQSRVPPPSNEQTRTKVAAIREKLAAVEAREKTAQYREALAMAEKLEEQIKTINYPPIQAEILYWVGTLLIHTGKFKQAETMLSEAASIAGKSKDALLAAKTMAWLVFVIGYLQARTDEGLLIARYAEIMLDISGEDKIALAMLQNSLACLFSVKKENEKSLDYFRKTLALLQQERGPNHPVVARAIGNVGAAFYNLGNYEEALEYHRKTQRILEKELGAENPSVAISLNQMGRVLSAQGKNDEALTYYQKSLAIDEKSLGPDHPMLAYALGNMGKVLKRKGDYDQAIDHLCNALIIRKKSLGLDHPDVTELTETLSEVLRLHNDFNTALEQVGDSLAKYEKVLGRDHQSGLGFLVQIGESYLKLGQPELSRKTFERFLASCTKDDCEPTPHGRGLFGLARALVATGGNATRALVLAKKAQDIFGRTPLKVHKRARSDGHLDQEHSFKNDKSKKMMLPIP